MLSNTRICIIYKFIATFVHKYELNMPNAIRLKEFVLYILKRYYYEEK